MTDKQSDDGLPEASVFAASQQPPWAVTEEWMRGWNAARTAVAAALAARQPEPVGEAAAWLEDVSLELRAIINGRPVDAADKAKRALVWIENASPAPQAAQAEQAEAPAYLTVEDCMRIIRAHAPDDLNGMEAAFRANTFATQPTASNAVEREAFSAVYEHHCNNPHITIREIAWRCYRDAYARSPQAAAINAEYARGRSDGWDAALATKPPTGEQKPVARMLTRQEVLRCTLGFGGQAAAAAVQRQFAAVNGMKIDGQAQPEQVAQDRDVATLTRAIQAIKGSTYNLTKDECIFVLENLRDDLRAARTRGEQGGAV